MVKNFCLFCFCLVLMSSNAWAARGRSAVWVGTDFNGYQCQGDLGTYGPYDYRNSVHRQRNLPIVEQHHFTRDVQRLNKGQSGYLIGDIVYTIKAFPNHYKALNAMMYYKILKKDYKRPVQPAVECYFYRAFNFFPEDATVRMLYAIYLKKIKKHDLADKYYLEAIEIAPKELRYRYIYGLYLVKQKKYKQAREQAELVYANNKYPQQKLKQQLKKAGHWE